MYYFKSMKSYSANHRVTITEGTEINTAVNERVFKNIGTAHISIIRHRRSQRVPVSSSPATGVNPTGDAGDTSPNILVGVDVNGNIPPILLRTFGYSRPILVALRSLSLKPISFGYKTPQIRFSQAGGQSAHKACPPNLELALTPLSQAQIQQITCHV